MADAIGITYTNRFDNQPLLARPIYASDLAQLTDLEASNRGIASLNGLEHAVNLRSLNLANNQISSLDPLTRRTSTRDEDAGAALGLSRLETLVLDNNRISDLSPLSLLTNHVNLSIDNNHVTLLDSLKALTSLQRLSVDRFSETTVTNNFDVNPNWLAFQATLGGNNYGYASTNLAGGLRPGEIGGRFARAGQDSYYLDTNIGNLIAADRIFCQR